MKKVSIIPMGGLCNRMRTIASTIFLARKYNLIPTIYWNNVQGLKANFNDLFNPIPTNLAEVIENRDWIHRVNCTKDYLLRWPLLKIKYPRIYFKYNLYTQGDLLNKEDFSSCQSLLFVAYSPMTKFYPLNEIFTPTDEIKKHITDITRQFDSNTVGVHIRRTDNKESINHSPLKAFIKLMEEKLKDNKDTTFYVASDDKATKEELTDLFPNKIITFYDETDRDSLEGMKFAVTDLYCLSNTREIIGSYFSSYSQIAAELGKCNIVYAQ